MREGGETNAKHCLFGLEKEAALNKPCIGHVICIHLTCFNFNIVGPFRVKKVLLPSEDQIEIRLLKWQVGINQYNPPWFWSHLNKVVRMFFRHFFIFAYKIRAIDLTTPKSYPYLFVGFIPFPPFAHKFVQNIIL